MKRLMRVLAGTSLALLTVSAATAQEPVTVDFYFPTAVDGPISAIIAEYADTFMADHPEIVINPVYTGSYTDARQVIQTEIQGGAPGPDVAVMLTTDLLSFAEEGYIVPVQPLIDAEEDGAAMVEDFYPAFLLNSVDDEGNLWAVPFQRSTPILFYNKDLFEEVGLDPEQPPRNREELVEYAQALTLPNGERWGLMVPYAGGFPIWVFQSFAIANGANLVDEDPSHIYLNTPEVVDAIEFMNSLSSEYGVQPAGGTQWGDTPTAFLEGQAAMIYHTTGSLTNILNNATFDVGVGFLPSGPAGEDGTGYGAPTGGGNLYLFANSSPEEQAAAWEWIKFLSSPEIQADWTARTGYIAARQSAWETEALQNLVAEIPAYAIARDQLAFASKEFTSYRAIDTQNIVNTVLSQLLSGERTDVQAALDEAQAQIDSLLEEYQ